MIEKQLLISVVMTAYNAEKYIKSTIESVLNQTFVDFEFLIYNDGSTDNTKSTIDSYKDSRIKATHLPVNMGVVYCANKGLREAQGKYIARMDADDICILERFQKQFNFLEKNPDVGLLGGYLQILGTDKIEKKPLHDNQIRWWFFKGCPIPQPAAMIRSSIIKKNKVYYDSKFKSAEDIEYWIQLAKHTKMANLPEVLVEYRVHPNQESTANIERQNHYRDMSSKSFFAWLGISNSKDDLEFARNLFSDLLSYDVSNTLKTDTFFKKLIHSKSAKSFWHPEAILLMRDKKMKKSISNLTSFHPNLFIVHPLLVYNSLGNSMKRYLVFVLKSLICWKTRVK